MPGGYPPQRLKHRDLLEPLLAPPHDRQMLGVAIDKRRQRIDAAPHRHIGDDVRIVVHRNIGGVIALADQPPDKALARLGNRIHRIERVPEIAVGDVIGRQAETRNVDLRQFITRHLILPQAKASAISRRVLSIPNSAIKLPIRGPALDPSSVSYSALNQSRRFSKP